ncbi:FliA/WhiG family RNA polymerase sigma factor [Aquibacillus salsiterrae]|uniref:FliA/WhiG family RNA polymerase sigma factor n=1 Tax=Aquibacillus salsiterrae TaxID=2950439 RepID=A0A9X3WBA9_9BACI|nr:FliA/WhiG family RNA polymerase sigma factor [Aquibacillus salsiterrae]MDC3416375.1 FliA/WhiG family RNA polymerase sigma factor [Aquibacillus salsiterrae]
MSKRYTQASEYLWERWLTNQDSETADQLIEAYMYLVSHHVKRIAIHLPANISKEELRSLGMMGLYDALKKFDKNRDLKFDTYASFRIRGAIIDGLRKEDWLPRTIRDKVKQVNKASIDLEQSLSRQPTSSEIGEALGMSVTEVEEVIKDSLFANLLSVEEKVKESSEDFKEGIGYVLPDQSTLLPEAELVRQENYQELEKAIMKLNDNEQLVVSLFYKEELSLTEIGHVLELTTSRISQIHKQAIYKLRGALSLKDKKV